MNTKVQKLRDELEKNDVKMAALKDRSRELERKIAEEEGQEIRALLRSEKLSMDDLVALLRARKENPYADAPLPDEDDDFEPTSKERKDDEYDEDDYE